MMNIELHIVDILLQRLQDGDVSAGELLLGKPDLLEAYNKSHVSQDDEGNPDFARLLEKGWDKVSYSPAPGTPWEVRWINNEHPWKTTEQALGIEALKDAPSVTVEHLAPIDPNINIGKCPELTQRFFDALEWKRLSDGSLDLWLKGDDDDAVRWHFRIPSAEEELKAALGALQKKWQAEDTPAEQPKQAETATDDDTDSAFLRSRGWAKKENCGQPVLVSGKIYEWYDLSDPTPPELLNTKEGALTKVRAKDSRQKQSEGDGWHKWPEVLAPIGRYVLLAVKYSTIPVIGYRPELGCHGWCSVGAPYVSDATVTHWRELPAMPEVKGGAA
jgi:hypothetical protein